MGDETFSLREAESVGHRLDLFPVQIDESVGWFGECHKAGPEYVRCFTFAPAHHADTLLRRWFEHVEESADG